MKKSFATLLLISVFTSVAFCQIRGQQPLVRIDSLPIRDTLPKETQPTVKREPPSSREMESEKSQGVSQQEDQLSGRVWVTAEYLLWKMKGSNLPPLITVGPAGENFATIGQPGTSVVFGGGRLNQGMFPGGRLTVGLWLNNQETVGAEISYFLLKKKTFRFQISSSGLPGSLTISIPYLSFDEIRRTIVENAFQVASDLSLVGGAETGTFSSRLQGADASMVYKLRMQCCRFILLAGFRYLDLNEGLTLENTSDFFPHIPRSPIAVTRNLTDQFNTRNQFFGGQAGLRSTLSNGRVRLEISGTVALGSNHETVNIEGAATLTVPPLQSPEHNFSSGLLASTSNIGTYGRNQFSVIPEVRASLGFDLTRSVRPFIGYQFLYWDKVVRPGEQIDRVVNLFTTGPRRPVFNFQDSRFWAQGITAGVRLGF